MVHSSTLAIATDGEHLTCGAFSLGALEALSSSPIASAA
jgi:hypothetical protein